LLFSSLLSVLAAAERWNHKTLGALGGIKKRISNKFKQERERKMEDAGRIWPYGFLSSFLFQPRSGGLLAFIFQGIGCVLFVAWDSHKCSRVFPFFRSIEFLCYSWFFSLATLVPSFHRLWSIRVAVAWVAE
jgi:hypothetical protein